MGAVERCLEGFDNSVKCPKCGFVSYPGIPQCKKCGHSFVPAKHKERESSVLSLFPGSPPPPAHQEMPAAPPPSAPLAETPMQAATQSLETSRPEPGSVIAGPFAAEKQDTPTEPARPWREELSERVEDFRRRRARLRGDSDRSANLEFDFQGEARTEAVAQVDANVIERASSGLALDIELKRPARPEAETPVLDSLSLDTPGEGEAVTASKAADAVELPLEPVTIPPPTVEIVMDSQPATGVAESEAGVLPTASMGRRFLAGMLDTLVLLVAVGIFALIFWRAGGRMSPQPLNLSVVSFIFAFFIMSYFGVFTTLTSTTPGLLWLGIEVRALDGTYPTMAQAFWRAFGYLVSIGALMLGFVWALVDTDGLTWHDRMSGTFLADAEEEVKS